MFSTDSGLMMIDVKGRLDEGGYKPDWHVTVDKQTVTIVDRRDLDHGFYISVLLPVLKGDSAAGIYNDQINCRHPKAVGELVFEGSYHVDEESEYLRLDTDGLPAFWLEVRGYYV